MKSRRIKPILTFWPPTNWKRTTRGEITTACPVTEIQLLKVPVLIPAHSVHHSYGKLFNHRARLMLHKNWRIIKRNCINKSTYSIAQWFQDETMLVYVTECNLMKWHCDISETNLNQTKIFVVTSHKWNVFFEYENSKVLLYYTLLKIILFYTGVFALFIPDPSLFFSWEVGTLKFKADTYIYRKAPTKNPGIWFCCF